MFDLFTSKTTSFRNLNGKSFKEAYASSTGAVLLDVRTPGEFSSGTIPGAQNADMMSPVFMQYISTLDKNVEYFVFCRSGARSAEACRAMNEIGLKVSNLSGGIGSWPRTM